MAEEKNSIIVYADWIDKFEDLSDEEAGQLIKHFFRYVNDLNPVAPDRIIKMAFHDIEKTLKRDLKKWELIKGKRSDAGKASAEAKKIAKQNLTKSTSVESVQQSSTKSTVSVSVNDSVSVTVNDDNIKTPSHNFYYHSDFEKVEWTDEFCLFSTRHSGLTIEKVKELLPAFLLDQKGKSRLIWEDEPDAKQHFINWLKKQPKNTKPSALRRVDN